MKNIFQGKIFKKKKSTHCNILKGNWQRFRTTVFCLTMHFLLNYICPAIHIYCFIKSFSHSSAAFYSSCSSVFRSTIYLQSFNPFLCLIVAFPSSFAYKALSFACWLNSQSRSSLYCSSCLLFLNIHSLLVLLISFDALTRLGTSKITRTELSLGCGTS